MRIQITSGLNEQLVSQDGSQVSSHYCLLLHGAVVLQGQDQRVQRCLGERDNGAKSEKDFSHREEGEEIIFSPVSKIVSHIPYRF